MNNLFWIPFDEIDLSLPFFDSLRADYPDFNGWFERKVQSNEKAYLIRGNGQAVEGFLYLKQEMGVVDDVVPTLSAANRLKIGTFKVNPHGTRLGERLLKKAFDHAIEYELDEIYLTVFPKHIALINLLSKYGFQKVAEKPNQEGHCEDVMVRSFATVQGDVVLDYPLIKVGERRNFVISIYPQWHTRLLPDSKLTNESPDIVKDVSHSNSIHKVYLTNMRGTESLERGDILAIYRTSDGRGPAEYRSVVTSICVVEEVRHISSFHNEEELQKFCAPYSVFTRSELTEFWKSKKYPIIIRFTYSASLKKRLTRGYLIDNGVIDRSAYPGFMTLSNQQLETILKLGEVNEGLIVNPA